MIGVKKSDSTIKTNTEIGISFLIGTFNRRSNKI